MGLIYNPTDSQGLVSALNANIRTADEMIESLNRASKHLIDALGNKTLSGAAFTAGKGMFSQLVIPMISKASQALDKLKSEAKQYEGFSANAGDDLLDEDKLNEQLQTLQMQQVALDSQISFFKQLAASHPDDSALNTSYADSSKQLSSFMSTTASDIQNVQEKLKKLHEFNTNVSPLFKDSTDELKTVSMIVLAIGAAEFDKAGKFVNSQKFVRIIQDINEKSSDTWYKDLGKSEIEELLSQETISDTINEIGHSYKVKGLESNINTRVGRGLFSKGEHLMEKAEGFGNCRLLKVGGGVFSALSIGLDYNDQMSQYNDVGRAIKNTAAHAAIGVGGSTAGAYIGGIIGSAIPVPGLGTIAGAAIGAGIGWAGSKAYDWVESGDAAKFVDNAGKQVSKTIDTVKDEAEKVFSGFGKSLGSVFG
ncbi:LXG domain-containing protein [Lactococcus cremoris]|uniref:LXG domain-containing protein n=1 Tax=Lactococcus lactis subsp. cremoris TaxID=1359 RepID=UPI001E3722D9|nr:LXG domain-containing protein [Lactococcus cremoris]MCD6632204.1 LXG domain-containing protein [Lactococcus cremoris]